MKRLHPLSILLLMPFQRLAAAEPENIPSSVNDLDVLQVVTPMILIVVLIFILAWLVKKMNRGVSVMGKDIKVIATTPLTSQARLCLVRVAGKDMLIGVTNQQISHLQSFDKPVLDETTATQPTDFAQHFKNLLNKKNTSN